MIAVATTERLVISVSDDGQVEAVLDDFPDSPKGRYWARMIEHHDGGSTSRLKRFDSLDEAKGWLLSIMTSSHRRRTGHRRPTF